MQHLARMISLQLLRLSICSIVLTVIAESSSGVAAQEKSKGKATFQLYYGGDAKLLESVRQEMKPGQIVVVDIRGLNAYQFGQLRRRANETKSKLLAYISIGELHSRELKLFESFVKERYPDLDFDALKSKVFISQNRTFNSLHVDTLNEVWCEFVFDRTADIVATGIDGLFLDTVDTVDVYIGKTDWAVERRGKSVTGMISLIRDLKAKHPSLYVMQNRGLNLIGNEVFVGDSTGIMIPGLSLAQANTNNPDAILFEDAFSSRGDWGEKVIRELDAIQRSGQSTVVALGYQTSEIDRKTFETECQRHQFVPSWAKDSLSLHLKVAR